MINLRTHTPSPRSTRALLALFAATAALAGAELALTPASAPALIAEECEPNEPGTCGPPEEGTPGGEPGEGQTQPGEVIVVEDTKPKEPEEKPVKTSSPDLRTLLGDTGGSGAGGKGSGGGGKREPPEGPQRNGPDPYDLHCGNPLSEFSTGTVAAKGAATNEERAKARARMDEKFADYTACRRTVRLLVGPPVLGNCIELRDAANAFRQADDAANAERKRSEFWICKARLVWEEAAAHCYRASWEHAWEGHSCWGMIDRRTLTIYRLIRGAESSQFFKGWGDETGDNKGLPRLETPSPGPRPPGAG